MDNRNSGRRVTEKKRRGSHAFKLGSNKVSFPMITWQKGRDGDIKKEKK